MMNIVVNDDPIQLKNGCTLELLLKNMSVKKHGQVAVAVNDSVVSRSRWGVHKLHERDRIILFS